eukprot:PLAT3832.3.p2 GENE.PLAT3832.3~~PLAT3832.3.p2  ORF type:complete len:214 (+),score=59.82 PLAT3832.3:385-1026(+)
MRTIITHVAVALLALGLALWHKRSSVTRPKWKRSCDPPCSAGGKCDDGTCVCIDGFRGVDCSEGWPLGFQQSASCTLEDCHCYANWVGARCDRRRFTVDKCGSRCEASFERALAQGGEEGRKQAEKLFATCCGQCGDKCLNDCRGVLHVGRTLPQGQFNNRAALPYVDQCMDDCVAKTDELRSQCKATAVASAHAARQKEEGALSAVADDAAV